MFILLDYSILYYIVFMFYYLYVVCIYLCINKKKNVHHHLCFLKNYTNVKKKKKINSKSLSSQIGMVIDKINEF